MDVGDLGERICILGPSNSGKSTLAVAVGSSRSLQVVHLDHYRHQPGTHWVPRPDAEFEVLHDAAVATDRWVIEGNYSRWLRGRLARATGIVLLDASTATSLLRYLQRTLGSGERVGGMEGVRDHISPAMIRFIVGPTRTNRHRYLCFFNEFDGPKVFLPNRRALQTFYRTNSLTRQRGR